METRPQKGYSVTIFPQFAAVKTATIEGVLVYSYQEARTKCRCRSAIPLLRVNAAPLTT
jgi:hypothetical protein